MPDATLVRLFASRRGSLTASARSIGWPSLGPFSLNFEVFSAFVNLAGAGCTKYGTGRVASFALPEFRPELNEVDEGGSA